MIELYHHGSSVCAAKVRFDRSPDGIGLIGEARLPDGGDVVDVDAQFDHRSCSSESTARVCSANTQNAATQRRTSKPGRRVAVEGVEMLSSGDKSSDLGRDILRLFQV